MKGKLPLAVAFVAIALIAIGVGAYVLRDRHQAQISAQVRAQLNAHLSEQFCCNLASIKEIHIDGRNAVVAVSVIGHPVQGLVTIVEDSSGAHVAPNREFDEAMHSAMRNDLLSAYNGMDRDGYLKYLPKTAAREPFRELDVEGDVQEHDPYIFGIGCEDRTCDTHTVAFTIDERTGEMIVAWVDNERKTVRFDGLPADKELPAPLYWYVSKRTAEGILSTQYALRQGQAIFFGWKYYELGDNP